MQYKGRKKNTDDYVDSQREPAGADILDNLPFVDLMHAQGQSVAN
jgi:hypothetical protein